MAAGCTAWSRQDTRGASSSAYEDKNATWSGAKEYENANDKDKDERRENANDKDKDENKEKSLGTTKGGTCGHHRKS